MKYLFLIITAGILSSCFTKKPTLQPTKVFGYKPIYGVDSVVKKLLYINTAQPVVVPGNIYIKDNFIFQLEVGKGIHVIDNSTPSQASRIGFLTVNGTSQISIKGNFLYTNSFDDLLVIDMSNINQIVEVKRIKGAFPQGRVNYYYAQPPQSGYYECPRYDSLVIGWRKDSVYNNICFKR